MPPEKITAETRTEFGKGAARRIRRADKVPAVLYTHGDTPQHITLPGHETMMALKHGGANALLQLEIDGKSQLGLTKQIQIDPITRNLEHVDFIVVKKGEKVTVNVPIHVTGEAADETLVVTENSVVSLEAEATHIPEYVEVSVEGAEVGTQIHASELTLPEGSLLLSDDEMLIINVTQQMSEEELEAELEEAEAEAGIEREEHEEEPEEGEAAEGEGEQAEGEGEAPAEDAEQE